jgi:thymidylate kinase
LAEAARAGSRIHVIDASQEVNAVHAAIWQIAARLLPAAG